ncbi:uncharacterized protein FIBRA_08968 [Fibroporia radiculosa]|uniref:Uncharacterized protein n=1 Tax=Fibroporia radiculosa TaxID=599839 RepID=J4GIL9_9APHY|nr:uncharacterized protein FIBRA_08968 [Fibroporia radiculosa]CCM06683.1 predicted protein [Fibroporia radiculosa]
MKVDISEPIELLALNNGSWPVLWDYAKAYNTDNYELAEAVVSMARGDVTYRPGMMAIVDDVVLDAKKITWIYKSKIAVPDIIVLGIADAECWV